MPGMDSSAPTPDATATRAAQQLCDGLRAPLVAGIESAVRNALTAAAPQVEQVCRELARNSAPAVDPWLEWLGPLLRAKQPTEILVGLLAAAEAATEAAIFVVRGSEAVYWKGRGLAPVAAVAIETASCFARAVATGHPISWGASQPLCETLPPGVSAASQGGVHPLLVRGKTIALIYWSGAGGASSELLPQRLQLLVEVTGRILESGLGTREVPAQTSSAGTNAETAPEAAPSPEPVAAAVPPLPASSSSPLEARARRYAKVLIEDLELYLNRDRPQEITAALEERDLYIRLRPDIEKCRLSYLEKFPPASGIGIHILEEELVRVLCKGNAAVLGSTYRGLAGT